SNSSYSTALQLWNGYADAAKPTILHLPAATTGMKASHLLK
ncbi:hypothetical protein LCGC14_2771760, partial [marine sediment metagenome]